MKDFVLSLDLGQARDFSTLVVLRRVWWRKGERADPDRARLWHQIPTIVRWKLGTPYPKIVEETAQTFTMFAQQYAQLGCALVVDAGGPGRPVVDMLKAKPYGLRPIPVTITGGDLPHERPDSSLTVPKRDICSALVVAAQSGDVKTAPGEWAEEFDREIAAFGYVLKPRARHASYESMEDEVNDDIVVAAALGLWYSTVKLQRTYFSSRQGGEVSEPHHPLARKR